MSEANHGRRMALRRKKSAHDRSLEAMVATQFPSFKLLPQELQNMIWQTAINSVKPCIVEVQQSILPSTRRSTYLQKPQFTSPCPVPGVLQACQASRYLALRRWKLSFAARGQDPKIFFDFNNDTLFLGTTVADMRYFVNNINRADREATQKLAFRLLQQWSKNYFHDVHSLCRVVRADFPALTQLIFPEIDLDAKRKEQIDSRWRRTQPRLDPRKTITVWRPAAVPLDWSFEEFMMTEFKSCCEQEGWSVPEMKRVDYDRVHLLEVEYDEDDRNMQKWHVDRMFEDIWGPVIDATMS
jgi:hypothetical protein